jgi:hypothetical protein
LWLLIVPTICWGQASKDSKEPEIDCLSSVLPITDTDLTSQKAALDSIATLLVGRWKLIKVESGWSGPKTPNWLSELIVDRKGQCVVRVDGNWVSGFQLTLTIERGWFFFTINQHKGSHFLIAPAPISDHYGRKRNNRGRLKLCESLLSLSDNSADGQLYLYERLTHREPNIASLTPISCQDSLSQVEQVQRVKGRVLFRDDLQAYIIDYALADSPFTHLIGIICNWPQAKDYINKTVSYSGKYFGLPDRPKVSGKQEIVYYLRITGFHPIE